MVNTIERWVGKGLLGRNFHFRRPWEFCLFDERIVTIIHQENMLSIWIIEISGLKPIGHDESLIMTTQRINERDEVKFVLLIRSLDRTVEWRQLFRSGF